MKRDRLVIGLCLIITGLILFILSNGNRLYNEAGIRRDVAKAAAAQKVVMDYQNKLDADQVVINKFYAGCVAGNKAFDALTVTQRQVLKNQGGVRADCTNNN